MLKSRNQQDIHCGKCSVSKLCIANGQAQDVIDELNSLIQKIRCATKSEHIFHSGDKVTNIYAVHTGSFKEYQLDENGNECINNFFLPGDIIGLESIPDRKHFYSTVALEDSQICVIPLDSLFELMSRKNQLLKRFIDIGSYKMQNDHQIRTTTNANQRLADFILNIFHRLQERDMYHGQIELPMSQLDISNFLGMAHETVNRILRSMHNQKIIQFKNKKISISDISKLEELGNSAA